MYAETVNICLNRSLLLFLSWNLPRKVYIILLHFLITASVPNPAELRHFFLIVGFCLSDHTSKASAITASVAISYCQTRK